MMRFVWVLACLVGVVWATCSGDCASCHFRLDYAKDTRHAPMRECKTCHTEEKMAQVDMGEGCGRDCFACHDVQRVRAPALMDSHKVIDTCIHCHQSLSRSLFDPTSGTQNIFEQSIKDFSPALTPLQDSK